MFQSFNSSLRPFATVISLCRRPLNEDSFLSALDACIEGIWAIQHSALRAGYKTAMESSQYAKPVEELAAIIKLVAPGPEYVGDGRYVYNCSTPIFKNKPIKEATIRKHILSHIKEAEQAYARMVY